jgi:hypothetical protein
VVCSSLVEVEGHEDLEVYYQVVVLWGVLAQEVGLEMAVNIINIKTAINSFFIMKSDNKHLMSAIYETQNIPHTS